MKLLLLALIAQAAPNVDPIQWHAPVANDVEWKVLAALILVGSALFSFGIHKVFARWEKQGWISEKGQLYGEISSYILSPILGAFAGYLCWHWGLGLIFAFVGSWASPWVMTWLNRFVGQRALKKKDEESE